MMVIMVLTDDVPLSSYPLVGHYFDTLTQNRLFYFISLLLQRTNLFFFWILVPVK